MSRAFSNYSGYVRALGLIAVLSSPLWGYSLLFSGDYDYGASLALVPLCLIVNLAAVVHVSRKDPFLRANLPIALLVKIAAAGLYLFMLFHVYGGGDTVEYFRRGAELASQFSTSGEFVILDPFWSTNFIYMVTSALVIVFGKAFPFIVVLFATSSFWGEYFAYRAFCIAMPEGDRELAGLLIFFLPSIVFWPATLGKDALIFFFIALSCYGFALLLRRPGARAYASMALGIGGVLLVRPHIAAMLAMAVTVPYAFARNRTGISGLLLKLVSIPLLIMGTWYLTVQATDFLAIEKPGNTAEVIHRISKNTNQGGSAFGDEQSLGKRLLASPFLLVRPFPWEIHNPQSAVAAGEGFLLLWLLYRRRGTVKAALWGLPTSAFMTFVVVYFIEFSLAFGAVTLNFGILTRERVMVLPYASMLLCAKAVQQAVAPVRAARMPRPMPQRRPTGVGA